MRELITHLWQSTLFAVMAGLLTVAFRKNRAQVRYWLWLTASLKFFVPFALLIAFGSRLSWAPVGQRIATPAVSFAVEYIALPISFAPAPILKPSRDWTQLLIIGIWSIGFLVLALIRLRLSLRVRAAVRESKPLDIPSTVEIREAQGLLEPGVVGLWRPTLLLPEGITDRLTPSELEAVIAHELCHIRRRDNLLASLHMAVEALFWFHPLVWWIGARLLEERERACDESVLSLGNQPRVYADAILNVCKLYTESPLVCVSGVTGSDIKKRIETIMHNRMGLKLNSAKKLLLAVAGIAALAVPVGVGILMAVGHIPEIHAQSLAPVPPSLTRPSQWPVQMTQLAQRAPTISDAPPSRGVISYRDRRLVTLFFDFTDTSADDQAKARQAAIQYVENSLTPTDVACVMAASPVTVVQDFTDDKSVLESAIQKVTLGSGNAGASTRMANLETASRMLAAFPEKKTLLYFSNGPFSLIPDNPPALRSAIAAAVQANIAIYPIDIRGASSGTGRGPVATAAPAGISQDEYNHRVADAEQKFGSASGEPAHTYIMYGPPDQIDNQPSSQIWRYNYLSNFHSSVEFEFFEFSHQRKTINYPPALATYTGVPAAAGLPVRHTTMGVYPAGEVSKLTVPLDSLSGTVNIFSEIRARAATGMDHVVSALQDTVKLNGPAQSGVYTAGFTLEAGSYVCRIAVREAETGKTFTEAIDFEVK